VIKSKAAIVQRLQTERRRLERNVSQLSPEDMLRPGAVGEWSVKDILAHLADWEAHMLVWVEAARGGDPVASPDPGLTWQQLDVFNQRVYERHRDQPLEAVTQYFRDTHRQFMTLVEAMPEEEMLTPSRYAFLGRDAIYKWLGAYAAHDLWGKAAIRKWLKTQRDAGATNTPLEKGPD
jgi:hypothetical protein